MVVVVVVVVSVVVVKTAHESALSFKHCRSKHKSASSLGAAAALYLRGAQTVLENTAAKTHAR